MVASHFADNKEGLFAGTPLSALFRVMLSELASDHTKCALFADATSAFLQTESAGDEDVYVTPPPDAATRPGAVWKLRKALPGPRKASHHWQDTVAAEFGRGRVQFRTLYA